jgi:hypothetical protein
MESSVFIKLLEYGEKTELNGTDFDEVVSWAVQNDILPSENDEKYSKQKYLLRDLFFEVFILNSGSTEKTWVLKAEYYFKLLEFRELKESRIAASEAKKYSNIAIVVSVIALVATIIIGSLQLKSSITISETQYIEVIDELKKINKIKP